ncbi:MAG: hypothetical protein KGI06_00325 [Candidatus Micrarchaeota archaeon]|nr:hypothetical protein [Candidatus Micrarchaeota archaeon]
MTTARKRPMGKSDAILATALRRWEQPEVKAAFRREFHKWELRLKPHVDAIRRSETVTEEDLMARVH